MLLLLHALIPCLSTYIRENIGRLSVGMAPTRPLSLNQLNGSELPNTAAMSPFRHITWPMSVLYTIRLSKGPLQ